MTPKKKIIIAISAFVVLAVVAIILFKKFSPKANPYEGMLVKGTGAAIYFIQDGKKRYVPTMEKLNQIKQAGVRSETISDADLSAIKPGADV